MTNLAPSILKQCLLPQTGAGTAGNRPHHRGTVSGDPILQPTQICEAIHMRATEHRWAMTFCD